MKSNLIVLAIMALTTIGVANAKQETNPNTRVVDQTDGQRSGETSTKPADIAMTKQIRKELMGDADLSMKAKNLRIIVMNNGVTLKGTVASAEEREKVLKHAYTTAPKHKIYNQISVVK